MLRQRFCVEADGRWTVSVASAAPTGLSNPRVQASLVLVIWLALGLLAFMLVQVLARGRARALRMVEEKTGQLRHQALHDALTGLPNRALIMDRAEQMLVHARRRRRRGLGDVHRPRRLQGRQRHLRASRRRRAAARSSPRGSPACCARPTRSAGSAATSSSCSSRAARSRSPQRILERAARAVRPRARARRSRSRPASASPPATARPRKRPAARRRHRALRGQGRRPQPLRRVPPRDAHRGARPARAGERPARRDRRATSCSSSTSRSSTSRPARSPAAEALLRWQHADARARPADRVHRARRGERADRRDRRLGARDRLRAGRAVGGRRLRRSASRSTSPRASSTIPGLLQRRRVARSRAPASTASQLVLEITETALMRDAESAAGLLARAQGLRRAASRSTTSAPATPRSPTCSSCRSTR